MSSFSNKKALRFVFTLATGKFGSSSMNQITLQGLRAQVDIDKAGGQMFGTLRAQIYGVNQSDMNSMLTVQWKPDSFLKNTVEVYAIDGAQQTLVFAGNVVNAWGNYQAMPDVFLEIQAQAGYFNQLQPVSPTSFKGSVDVATLMSQLATSMGYTFENNGVAIQISNPYLPNTGLEQAKNLAQATGIDLYLDDNVLAITPANTARGGLIPEVSGQSGLIRYPTVDGRGVNFQTLFNPAIRFGGSVNLVTDIPQANATWIVTSIGHRLESEKPGGSWFSMIRGNKSGLAFTR